MIRKLLKVSLLLAGIGLYGMNVQAQMLQSFISSQSGRSELVTRVKTLPDGTAVLGGYIYNVSGGAVVKANMLLLRVDQGGNILWQREFGTKGSDANDLLNGLTIAKNGDIILVGTMGRSSAYTNNTATIMRFDNAGALKWAKFVRKNTATTDPGEVFNDVAELDNGNIIAVGGAVFQPGSSMSMLCMYDPLGNLMYNETYDRPNSKSDEFLGVCAAGNDAIITGWFDDDSYSNYKDSRVMRYTPGPASGTVVWDKQYNLSGAVNSSNTAMPSDGLTRVYVRGNRIVANGGGARTWGQDENIQTFFECDLSNGGNATIRGLYNNALPYANNTAFYPVDQSRFFVAQNPATSFKDATLWTSATLTNAVISEIQPFTSSLAVQSKEFNLPGNQSILDIDMNGNNLYMGGCTSSTGNAVDNDIYYVFSQSSLSNPNKKCDLVDGKITIISPTLLSVNAPPTLGNFPNIPNYGFEFMDPALISRILCEEPIDTTHHEGGDCSSQCYWRVDGNAAINSTNILGPLNDEDIRFVTNGTQRAVLTRQQGDLGINTPAPTARLHVLCQPQDERLSDVRFENLSKGHGNILVIDDDGYVYRSEKDALKPADPENNESQAAVIAQLQKDVAYLIEANRQISQNSAQPGSEVNLYPNPATNQVQLSIGSNSSIKAGTVQVTDVSGKVLITQKADFGESRSITINTAALLPGSYYVKLIAGGKTQAIKSLTIMK